MVGTVALGLLLPFAGTTLGAGAVFFLKREIGSKVQKMLLGFASGVMIAASVWSLILPSAELAKEAGTPEWQQKPQRNRTDHSPASFPFLCYYYTPLLPKSQHGRRCKREKGKSAGFFSRKIQKRAKIG